MQETYAVSDPAVEAASSAESPVLSSILSAILIIGLPTAFWMGIIELANITLGMGLTSTVRFIIAGILAGLLFVVWCFITVSARQQRSQPARKT